jgi:zinc transport system substrate-binding protein
MQLPPSNAPRPSRTAWKWGSAVAACITLAVSACEKPSPVPPSSANSAPIRIVATIPPLRGLVAPLLADSKLPHELTTLVPAGASEHGFEIPPDKLVALGKADIVVMAGLGMEPQVEKFLAEHPSDTRRVVDLGKELDDHLFHSEPEPDDHGHDDHDHHHHIADPHLWLDPNLAKLALNGFVAVLKPGLSEKQWNAVNDARGREADQIDAIDQRYQAALKDAPRRTIVVAHDAYGYLAKRYNLEVIAITGLNAGEPRPGDLKRAADAVREHQLTTIFVEPQLSPAAAERLAVAAGAKVAVLDPLGDGDWFKLMEKNLAALKDALGVKNADPADKGSPALPGPAAKPPEKPS